MKHQTLFVYATALALSSNAAHARPHRAHAPTLSWLLKQHDKASGNTLAESVSQHTVYTIAAGGLTGTLDEHMAGTGKFRVEIELGPLHLITADDGVQAWEQDSTGNVRIVRGPELTEQRAETTFSIDTYDPLRSAKKGKVTLRPKRDGVTRDYIVDATPLGGTTQTLYINPHTFLVDKMVIHQGGITGSIDIRSYKTVEGVRTPAHLDIGYAGLPVAVSAILQSAEYGRAIDTSVFSVPKSGRDFEFLRSADADEAEIPFETDANEVVVPITINGRKFRFLLDSGAASSFILSDAAQAAGLKPQGHMAAVGYGGTAATGIAAHSTVDIADALRLKNQLLYVVQSPLVGKMLKERTGVDGALGYDIFARLTVKIDYANGQLTLSAPGKILASKDSKSIVLPIKLQNHTPTVAAALDGRPATQFLVDTGDNGDLHLYTQYAKAQKINNTIASPGAIVRVGVGVGGYVQEIMTPGHRLNMGGTLLQGVSLSTMNTAGINDASYLAGGIGNAILKRFTVTFDYGGGVLRLAKPSVVILTPSPVTPTPSSPQPAPPPPPLPIAPPPAQAKSNLSIEELMAKHVEALGGRQALDSIRNTRIFAGIDTGGIQGTVTTAFAEPGMEFEEDDLGVLKISQGYNGKEGWRADGNGNRRTMSADELSDIRNEIFLDTNSYAIPGRLPGTVKLRAKREAETGDYIVDIDPLGGKSAVLYFDPKTFLMAKEQHSDDKVITTTSYEDYQAVNGAMFPMKQHVTNGNPRYDIVLTVKKVENNVDLPPHIFDTPARDGVPLLLGGAKSATIHFDLDNGEIGIPVLIDGHKEKLLFDSGASSIALSKKAADKLKIPLGGILEARGYGGSTDLHPIRIDTLEIPGVLSMKKLAGVAVTLPASLDRFLNNSVAGFIGYDLLSQFVIRIDYDKQTMTFIDPPAFTPSDADGTPLAIQLDNDIPSLTARLDSLPPAQYLVDTGDFTTLRMFEPYISDNKLNRKYPNGSRTSGGGIAGVSESRTTTIDRYSISHFSFTDVPAEFSLDPKGGASELNAGSIGAGLLSRFRVTFDYPSNKIYFALAPNAYRPFESPK